MGKGGGSSIRVAEYRMSLHLGICAGPVDHISGIYGGEKEAWSGRLDEPGVININRDDLYGGIKKEGGMVGAVTFLPGRDDQVMPEFLAAKLGKTSATCHAYRRTASIFLTEQISAGGSQIGSGSGAVVPIGQWLSGAFSSLADGARKGFYLAANNPYLKPIWAKVARASWGLDTRYAKLWRNANGEYVTGPTEEFDTNAAHIIFECLTDKVWGMGALASSIDVASFESAAYTLYNEGFGLSLMWSRSAKIEDFVGEILDHIEATLFINPRSGQLTLKLLRFDYDPDSLPVFNNDNAVITNFARKHWGETINEIVVTWTNPKTENEETTTAQDLANIAMQGGVVSDGRNYYGVRSAALAQALAERDLRAASYPLASCDVELDRRAWALLPGDVVKLESPEDNIGSIIMRVGPINYGQPGQGKIRISLAEDVFSLATAEYVTPPPTEHEDGSEDPAPAAFDYEFTLPYFVLAGTLGPTAAEAVPYPTVYAGVLAGQTGADTASFDLVGTVVDTVGNVSTANLGTFIISAHAVLGDDIPAQVTTIIESFSGVTQGEGPTLGGFVVIGNSDQPESVVELAVIETIDGDGYHLRRGILDTVPRPWDAGTEVWFVADAFVDTDQRAAFEEVEYRIRTRTSRGTLPLADAPIEEVTLTERPHLPTRPAKVAFGLGELPFGWQATGANTTVELLDIETDAEGYERAIVKLTYDNSAGTAATTPRLRLSYSQGMTKVPPTFWSDWWWQGGFTGLVRDQVGPGAIDMKLVALDDTEAVLVEHVVDTGLTVEGHHEVFGVVPDTVTDAVYLDIGFDERDIGDSGSLIFEIGLFRPAVDAAGDTTAAAISAVNSARVFETGTYLDDYATGEIDGWFIVWGWQEGPYTDETENSGQIARIVSFVNSGGTRTITIDRDPSSALAAGDNFFIVNDEIGADFTSEMFAEEIDASGRTFVRITWARRNRLTENTQVLAWDDDDITPEVGQTTRIEVRTTDGDLLTAHTGITGTMFDLPTSSFLGSGLAGVSVLAEKDGLISLQGRVQRVKVDSGYGIGYGYNYGGA